MKIKTIDKAGTITAGGTAQNVYPAPQAPNALFSFKNISAEVMNIAFGITATATNGFRVDAGGSYEFPAGLVPLGRCSVFAATTGSRWLCTID